MASLKTLPPLVPTHLLNAARNYPEYALEMAGRNAEAPSATIPASIPGDIIATGTPTGVGTARAEPIYMKPGDQGVCTIGGIGLLANPVTGPSSR